MIIEPAERTSWDTLSSDIDDARVRVGIQIEFVSDAIALRQRKVLRPYASQGITSRDDYRTLAIIHRFGERGASVTELAETLGVTPGTISNRIDRLHSEGHLTRIPHERDRRSHRVGFAPQGERLINEMIQAVVQVHVEFFAALNESQCGELSDLLALCMD